MVPATSAPLWGGPQFQHLSVTTALRSAYFVLVEVSNRWIPNKGAWHRLTGILRLLCSHLSSSKLLGSGTSVIQHCLDGCIEWRGRGPTTLTTKVAGLRDLAVPRANCVDVASIFQTQGLYSIVQ